LDVALWLPPFILENGGLKLNGALSNPQAGVELSRLGALHDELLRRASVNPLVSRPVSAKVSPVLETVTLVLELAGKPMRAREIHAAAEQLLGQPLRWTSVKGALAGYASGPERRFRRVRHGIYEIACSAKQVARSLRNPGRFMLTLSRTSQPGREHQAALVTPVGNAVTGRTGLRHRLTAARSVRPC
jgi:hypothetical protein